MSERVGFSLVDFGWILSCQQSLRFLFRQWGWPDSLQGYYLGLKTQRIGSVMAGQAEALFYEPENHLPDKTLIDSIFNNILLLEHIVGCADHPTVHHYEEDDKGKAVPVFASSVNEVTSRFCQNLNTGVFNFISQNQGLIKYFSDDVLCREVLARLTTSFFKFPTKASVYPLGGLTIAVDQNGLARADCKTIKPCDSSVAPYAET